MTLHHSLTPNSPPSIALTGSLEDMEMTAIYVEALHVIALGPEAGVTAFLNFPVVGGFLLYREACHRAPQC